MRKQATLTSVICAGLVLAAAASADPYNPAERALGGGLIDTGTTAAGNIPSPLSPRPSRLLSRAGFRRPLGLRRRASEWARSARRIGASWRRARWRRVQP